MTDASTPALELPVVFQCGKERLLGIVHRPSQPCRTGVLVVPGGPTYRVGSHRQFVQMARDLAAADIAVLRFDTIGMGDSEGAFLDYERVDEIDAQLRAAIDALLASVPALQRVVLWGLCGSCCANLLYAHQDARVAGLALVNPWVRTPQGLARTQLWHYYPQRLCESAFWRDVLGGKLRIRTAVRDLLATMAGAWRRAATPTTNGGGGTGAPGGAATLAQRMLEGLRRFPGPVLFILSDLDLTAQEFKRLVAGSSAWRKAMRAPQVACQALAGADHTFSSATCRAAASALVRDWVQALDADLSAAGCAAATPKPRPTAPRRLTGAGGQPARQP